jgi:hypothetical protein
MILLVFFVFLHYFYFSFNGYFYYWFILIFKTLLRSTLIRSYEFVDWNNLINYTVIKTNGTLMYFSMLS